MVLRSSEEFLMRRYFLGNLPPEELDRLEIRYLSDKEFFEELLAVENDLIDEYVRGELTGGEKQRFEAAYLISAVRRERVEFSRALSQVSASAKRSHSIPRNTLWKKIYSALTVDQAVPRWALTAAVLALVSSGAWMLVQNSSLRANLQQASVGQVGLHTENDALRRQLAGIQGAQSAQAKGNSQSPGGVNAATKFMSMAALTLTPGGVRGLGAPLPTLHMPFVELKMILDQDNYKVYEAELQTADGKTVLKSEELSSRSESGKMLVSWPIPAQAVPPGDYIAQLKGVNERGGREDVLSYSFRVLAR